MKKMVKGISLSLCAMLLLAGCSCKKETVDTSANISNADGEIVSGLKDDVKSMTLEEIYEELKASSGNKAAADKLLKLVGDLVLSDADWQTRYDTKVEEKLLELTNSSEYEKDGIFDEETLVKYLNSQLYSVTCENNTYGPTYAAGKIDKYMVCDYSDYVEKNLKVSILTELLNEKYVYDKVMVDKENILTTKKARLVEYIALDYSSDTEEDEVIKHIEDAVAKLVANEENVTLESIANSWKEKKVEEIVESYNKIHTSEDSNGSILQEFTDGYKRTPEKGLEIKKADVEDKNYYEKIVITSDSKDILNTTLVERLLSENVLSETAKKTIKVNNSYYLVAPWAGNSVDANDIRIKDSTNSKYYIVKVEVINNDSAEDMKYEAVKILAQNTSLVSDSISYYLEQHKNDIGVYDEEIYTYLKAQYKDIFVD